MLVYGDAQFAGELQALRRRLGVLAQEALAQPHDLDRLRSLLIACGQVEQAAHDALAERLPSDEAAPWIDRFHRATACAAEAFYALAHRQPIPLPAPLWDAGEALHRLVQELGQLAAAPDAPVLVKLPEGFGFHALYPEQYLVAAGQWLRDHTGQRERGAVVAGIRSIGTTLAAVVSAALRAAGWPVQSCTVRPTGHPFDRQVTLSGMALPLGAFGLVVDEGPGISGSSLVAAGAVLVAAGLAREDIAFLPGHANGPGGAGSDEVQSWWRSTPCYVAGSDKVVFGGRSLHDALAAMLPEPATGWDDLSGGVWRQHVYDRTDEWPAICTAFERVKHRCTLASGRRVLFKFMGLAAMTPDLLSTASSSAALLADRAERGLASQPLGTALGFVAVEWVEGAPLAAGASWPGMAAVLGDYIARVAGPPLTQDGLTAAQERLREMFCCNVEESLGQEAGVRAQLLAPVAAPGLVTPGAVRLGGSSYGDGHLQPHEWIVHGGELIKVDSVGHDCDHTLVGPQPVAWDLAGAIVEWQLDAAGVEELLRAFYAAGGEEIAPAALRFHQAAYLAFRTGQCALAAQVHDPYERPRLWDACTRYREGLGALLDQPSGR